MKEPGIPHWLLKAKFLYDVSLPVTVEIEMKFNGSIDQSLNIDNITRDICREVRTG
jgi:hypothetical protein